MDKILGTFQVKSSKLMVTDPCYDKGTWCQGVLENVKNGEWVGIVDYHNDDDWGRRISAVYAFYNGDDRTIGDLPWQKQSKIDVGVDSGQAGLFDERLYPQDPRDSDNEEDFYTNVCDLTLSPVKAGVIPFGVVASSGFGDGSYTCFTQHNKAGAIVGAKIVFIDPEEKVFNPDDEPEEDNLDSDSDEADPQAT